MNEYETRQFWELNSSQELQNLKELFKTPVTYSTEQIRIIEPKENGKTN